MGVVALILGHSGSGKSTSLRNFEPEEVAVLNVAGKRMPFRKRLPSVENAGYPDIINALGHNSRRVYVIDDANYLMQFANFAKAREKGYDKFVGFALDFETMLRRAAMTDDDTVVYIMMHPDYDDSGRMKPKTVGKMLDNQLTIEGLVPIVLVAYGDESGYHFQTNDPMGVAKSPDGMFDGAVMPNDLKAVDTAIREFWDMKPALVEGRDAK